MRRKRKLLGERAADPLDICVLLRAFVAGSEPDVLPERVGLGLCDHCDMIGIKRIAAGIDLDRAVDQRAVYEHARKRDERHDDDCDDGEICHVGIGFLLCHRHFPVTHTERTAGLRRRFGDLLKGSLVHVRKRL